MRFVASTLLAAAVIAAPALAQTAPATQNMSSNKTAPSTPNAPIAQSMPDAAAGKQKTAMCAGCHGIPGWRTAYPEVYHVPMIHGQHQSYIVKALQAYKNGERSHPSMRAIASSLTDQDMANLAAYYGAAAEPSKPVAPDSAKVSAAPGAPATPTK
jgi:cytochrome c553